MELNRNSPGSANKAELQLPTIEWTEDLVARQQMYNSHENGQQDDEIIWRAPEPDEKCVKSDLNDGIFTCTIDLHAPNRRHVEILAGLKIVTASSDHPYVRLKVQAPVFGESSNPDSRLITALNLAIEVYEIRVPQNAEEKKSGFPRELASTEDFGELAGDKNAYFLPTKGTPNILGYAIGLDFGKLKFDVDQFAVENFSIDIEWDIPLVRPGDGGEIKTSGITKINVNVVPKGQDQTEHLVISSGLRDILEVGADYSAAALGLANAVTVVSGAQAQDDAPPLELFAGISGVDTEKEKYAIYVRLGSDRTTDEKPPFDLKEEAQTKHLGEWELNLSEPDNGIRTLTVSHPDGETKNKIVIVQCPTPVHRTLSVDVGTMSMSLAYAEQRYGAMGGAEVEPQFFDAIAFLQQRWDEKHNRDDERNKAYQALLNVAFLGTSFGLTLVKQEENGVWQPQRNGPALLEILTGEKTRTEKTGYEVHWPWLQEDYDYGGTIAKYDELKTALNSPQGRLQDPLNSKILKDSELQVGIRNDDGTWSGVPFDEIDAGEVLAKILELYLVDIFDLYKVFDSGSGFFGALSETESANYSYFLTLQMPAAFSPSAVAIYRKVLDDFVSKTAFPRGAMPEGRFFVDLFTEAEAVAEVVLQQLDPPTMDETGGEAPPTQCKYLIVLDVGAGTVDYSVVAYTVVDGDTKVHHQDARESTPRGGNALDKAIAKDLIAKDIAIAQAKGGPSVHALQRWVEVHKRKWVESSKHGGNADCAIKLPRKGGGLNENPLSILPDWCSYDDDSYIIDLHKLADDEGSETNHYWKSYRQEFDETLTVLSQLIVRLNNNDRSFSTNALSNIPIEDTQIVVAGGGSLLPLYRDQVLKVLERRDSATTQDMPMRGPPATAETQEDWANRVSVIEQHLPTTSTATARQSDMPIDSLDPTVDTATVAGAFRLAMPENSISNKRTAPGPHRPKEVALLILGVEKDNVGSTKPPTGKLKLEAIAVFSDNPAEPGFSLWTNSQLTKSNSFRHVLTSLNPSFDLKLVSAEINEKKPYINVDDRGLVTFDDRMLRKKFRGLMTIENRGYAPSIISAPKNENKWPVLIDTTLANNLLNQDVSQLYVAKMDEDYNYKIVLQAHTQFDAPLNTITAGVASVVKKNQNLKHALIRVENTVSK